MCFGQEALHSPPSHRLIKPTRFPSLWSFPAGLAPTLRREADAEAVGIGPVAFVFFQPCHFPPSLCLSQVQGYPQLADCRSFLRTFERCDASSPTKPPLRQPAYKHLVKGLSHVRTLWKYIPSITFGYRRGVLPCCKFLLHLNGEKVIFFFFTHPADGGQKRSQTFSVGRTVDGSTSCVLLEWKWGTDNWLAVTHNQIQYAWKWKTTGGKKL